jgi:hypothetical protein
MVWTDNLIYVVGGIAFILLIALVYIINFQWRPMKAAGGDVLLKCYKKKVPLFIFDTGKSYIWKAPDDFVASTGLENEQYIGYAPPHSMKVSNYGILMGFGDNERGVILPPEIIKFIGQLRQLGYDRDKVNEEIKFILDNDLKQQEFAQRYYGKDKRFFKLSDMGKIELDANGQPIEVKGVPKTGQGKDYNKPVDVVKLKDALDKDFRPRLEDVGVVKEFFRWGTSKTLTNLKLQEAAERLALLKYDPSKNFAKWMPILMGAGIFIVILVMAYVMFSQYTNYEGTLAQLSGVQTDLAMCKASLYGNVGNSTIVG